MDDLETEVWALLRKHIPNTVQHTEARKIVADIVEMIKDGKEAAELDERS